MLTPSKVPLQSCSIAPVCIILNFQGLRSRQYGSHGPVSTITKVGAVPETLETDLHFSFQRRFLIPVEKKKQQFFPPSSNTFCFFFIKRGQLEESTVCHSQTGHLHYKRTESPAAEWWRAKKKKKKHHSCFFCGTFIAMFARPSCSRCSIRRGESHILSVA